MRHAMPVDVHGMYVRMYLINRDAMEFDEDGHAKPLHFKDTVTLDLDIV